MLSLSRALWMWLGCAGMLTAIGCSWTGVTILIDPALAGVGAAWCAVLAGTVWCLRRPAVRGAAAPFQFFALLIATSAICSSLQYAAARTGRRLIDAELAAFDHALYFDWPACFAWVLEHPAALTFFSAVYLSLGPQNALLGFVAWKQSDRAIVYAAANALTLSCCLGIFAIWPAAGPFIYYEPVVTLSDYIPHFTAARSDPHMSLAFGQMTGIISFPSYHAAAAVLLGYAFAALPRGVAFSAFVIEIALAISAVLVGGHYLIDVLAGVLIAVASLTTVRSYARRLSVSPSGRVISMKPGAMRGVTTARRIARATPR